MANFKLLDVDAFNNKIIDIVSNNVPLNLRKKIDSKNVGDEVVDFIINYMSKITLLGEKGLKSRTGLMEYRYDIV